MILHLIVTTYFKIIPIFMQIVIHDIIQVQEYHI